MVDLKRTINRLQNAILMCESDGGKITMLAALDHALPAMKEALEALLNEDTGPIPPPPTPDERQKAAVGVKVQGRCPSCRNESLFLGSNGYVTCAIVGGCKYPGAATDILRGRPWKVDADRDPSAPYRDAWTELDTSARHAALLLKLNQGMGQHIESAVELLTVALGGAMDHYGTLTTPDARTGPSTQFLAHTAAQRRAHVWRDKHGKDIKHGDAVFSDSDVRCRDCRAYYIDPITFQGTTLLGCPGPKYTAAGDLDHLPGETKGVTS